jgi:CRP-like cAMP-binding protein
MTGPLRVQLITRIYDEFLNEIKLFKMYEASFITEFLIHIRPFEVKRGENILEFSDISTDFYFVLKGFFFIIIIYFLLCW